MIHPILNRISPSKRSINTNIILRQLVPSFVERCYDQKTCHYFMSTTTSSTTSSWPKLESATGRARKRRRRRAENLRKKMMEGKIIGTSQIDEADDDDDDDETNRPYPKGRPWLVLSPDPHGRVSGPSIFSRNYKIPTWSIIRQGWKNYMDTWEGGFHGVPKEKEETDAGRTGGSESTSTSDMDDSKEMSRNDSKEFEESVSKLTDNTMRNVRIVKKDAEEIIKAARDNQNEIRAFASDMLRIATECLKEFMAGYRHGRDQEIDKMLNEYFQEEDDDDITKDKNDDHNKKKKQEVGKNVFQSTPKQRSTKRKRNKKVQLRQ